MVFSGVSGKAFALIAADGMMITGSQSYTFYFQKVNVATSTASEDAFWVSFDGAGPIGGDEFRKPEQLNTTVRFGGKPVPPGDYAFVSRYDNATYGVASTTNVNCFSLASAVFRIREGKINVIPAGSVREPHALPPVQESQVAQVVAGYPKFSAPIVFAELIGSVTFQTERNLFGSKICKIPGAFTFTPLRGAPG